MTAPPVAAGFDMGGTNIRVLPLRVDGTIGDTIKMDRPAEPEAMIDAIVDLTARVGDVEDAPVTSVGVGCAGLVDADGMVRTSPNIPTLVRFPLKQRLEERLGLPVAVDNDATTATWAEARLGAARGVDDVAFVALGTGIGTGFVVGGVLHHGAGFVAGESGHMVIEHDGIPCVCGRRGCWERYASGTAFGRLAREAAEAGRADSLVARAGGDPSSVTSEHAAELIAAGDPAALAILDELGYWSAVGIANLVNVLDPGVVVIGGGVADIGQVLVDAIERAYRQVMVDVDLRDPLPFALSHFGGRSGAIGAALLAAGS